jgi:SAM-dependent methyltransferase
MEEVRVRGDYAEVFQSPVAVDKYDRLTYAPGTYASLVADRQRRYLRSRLPRWFAEPPVHHDFACGTGRGIAMLDGLVRRAHGYDTSPAMLDRARERHAAAVLHLLDRATGPVPDLGDGGPDGGPSVVTMFRFLLNVDGDDRDTAMDFAGQILEGADSGLLVVENHGPRDSLRGLNRRRRRGEDWFAELSHREVEELLARHGFRLVARKGFGVLPSGAYADRLLRAVARPLDGVAWRLPTAAVSTNVLYVASRQHR